MTVKEVITLDSWRFIHSFWQVRQQIISQVNPRVREEHGVDFLEVMILEQIGNTDMSPSEIAEEMQIPAHNISRKLDGLEKAGLIKRALDPSDARRRVLSLTSSGKKVADEAQKALDREVERMLGVLSADDAAAMIQSLETVAQRRIQEDTAQGNTAQKNTVQKRIQEQV